jgi:predicted ATPase
LSSTDRLFVLTGAPGTGKTAILRRLGRSTAIVAEPAREILAEHRAAGHRGHIEFRRFVRLLLERSIEKHGTALEAGGPALFDRAVPDCIAYGVALDTPGDANERAARRYRYHTAVLLLEPWADIYTTDDERTMTFDQTIPFHDAIVDAYRRHGYDLVSVPRGSIEQRAAFVRMFLAERGVG